MGRKIAIGVLGFLTVAFFGLGITGLVRSKIEVEKKEPVYLVKYNYYVDDEEVSELPTITDELKPEYIFNRYSCTNKVVGEWDNENWKFVPVLTNNATCKLYFNRAYYKVNFEIEYGELRNMDGSVMTEEQKAQDITIDREQNLTVKIEPDEGYTLVSVECDNNNVTDWNKDNKELTVKSVTSDTTCKVKFQISVYDVEVKVTNGSGATTLNIEHGKQVNASIIPTTGYGNVVINCTNGQSGVWADNKFTIERLTNSTSCDISFSPLQYDITVNVTGGVATPAKTTVQYNSTRSIEITPDENHRIDIGYTVTGCPNYDANYADGKLILKVYDVITNLTCNVVLQEADKSSEPSTTTSE